MSEEQNKDGAGRDYIADFKALLNDAEANFGRAVGAAQIDPASSRSLMLASQAQSSLATAIGIGLLIDYMRSPLIVGPPPSPMERWPKNARVKRSKIEEEPESDESASADAEPEA